MAQYGQTFHTAFLLSTSVTSAYLLQPHLVDRTCALHPVASNSLYLFCTCRLRWGSEVSPLMDGRVSPSMDRPPGTVCHLHYESTSTRAITERFHTCTEDATVLDCPAPRYFYAILTPNHGLSRRYDGSRHDE